MLFGVVDDGTFRLSIVVGRAVVTRNFVDDILRPLGRRSSLCFRQQVMEGYTRRVGNLDVVGGTSLGVWR